MESRGQHGQRISAPLLFYRQCLYVHCPLIWKLERTHSHVQYISIHTLVIIAQGSKLTWWFLFIFFSCIFLVFLRFFFILFSCLFYFFFFLGGTRGQFTMVLVCIIYLTSTQLVVEYMIHLYVYIDTLGKLWNAEITFTCARGNR